MTNPATKRLRQIPFGYILGRTSPGNGPPELIRTDVLFRQPAAKSMIQQVAANNLVAPTLTVLANITGAAAQAVGVTITQILDLLTGVAGSAAARGSMIFRGASGWSLLAPGTSGQYLKTNGAGADPSWLTPPTPNAGTMPLTSGDVGPGVMDDHQGQTIAVALGATTPYRGTSMKTYMFVTTSGALPASPNYPPGATAIAYCTDISRCRIWDPSRSIWAAALG